MGILTWSQNKYTDSISEALTMAYFEISLPLRERMLISAPEMRVCKLPSSGMKCPESYSSYISRSESGRESGFLEFRSAFISCYPLVNEQRVTGGRSTYGSRLEILNQLRVIMAQIRGPEGEK